MTNQLTTCLKDDDDDVWNANVIENAYATGRLQILEKSPLRVCQFSWFLAVYVSTLANLGLVLTYFEAAQPVVNI